MKVSDFVSSAVDAMGGIYEPIEWNLALVMVPDEYAGHFNGSSEFTLAFDHDVARENPHSEFAAYGSFVLDAFIDIVRSMPKVLHRYVNPTRLDLVDAENKIAKRFQTAKVPKIASKELGAVLFCRFNFSVKLISDETAQTFESVTLNLLTGKADGILGSQLFTSDRFEVPIPDFAVVDVEAAYETALEEVKAKSESNPLVSVNAQALKSDQTRIRLYYDELIAENEKRARTPNAPEKRLAEVEAKRFQLESEKERQLIQMEEKYMTKFDIQLENAIVYHVPFIRYGCAIESKRGDSEFEAYYNLDDKEFYSF